MPTDDLSTADFRVAATCFADLVAQVPADAWDRPALGSWDARSLVGHTARALTTVVDYLATPAAGAELGSPAEYLVGVRGVDPALHEGVAERGVEAGRALGADPASVIRRLVAEVLRTLDGTVGDPALTTILGAIALSDYLPTRTFELTVHSLDLATALGLDPRLDPGVTGRMLALVAEVATRNGESDQLLRALTGRTALSPGYSVL